ncbi:MULTISPECIES: EutN/CcmL family microcompartment protein [Desulfosporosinus]|uniref:Ethanolamine utilization protein EutN n=2 Tax=Desulfosporosinus TaxID=79206 RepID=A0A1G7UBL5_9FIRM|nr:MULTISPECIES: EutN/CcmL family microcompartment protein [Desulfosporosinus]AFQ46194.1 carbon dioxide concentrating mechanism/carboxysome shell protein [Desulfosporosinus meridiei DSM 13257]KGK85064.1 ethanolamine utilization protein EutN [Desulfosporosinus sp. HMP52]SDG44847.1 ethanolamine utilization protein EutN [Desulfosporosinus hippei DSM 8344]
MIAAKVIDSIWSTRKADSLIGLKFMLIEVLGGIDAGRIMIAADTIGAGIGERVLVCNGSSARKMFDREDIPIDSAIVGIIDEDCTF